MKRKNRNRWRRAGLVFCATLVLTFLAKHYEFPDIQINHIEELTISGVNGEYEFLFLTDLHLAVKTRENLGVLGDADVRMAGFVNPQGTMSAKQLPQWISYANQEQVDAVLMGGDMIDYYSDANAVYLKGQLDKLAMPYVFTIGNHDMFSPWEEEVPAEAAFYGMLREGNTAFQILEYEDLVICAIDNESYQVNEASLIAMKEWLSEHPDKPMILLAHVPFYTEQIQGLKETSTSVWGQPLVIGEGVRDTTAVTREFMELIFGEKSSIVAVFTGDNHFYYKGNLTDSIPQWVFDPSFAGNGTIIRVRGNEETI